ncbi:hypothetical protein Tco_0957287, partial [Tanacetum coccineum]
KLKQELKLASELLVSDWINEFKESKGLFDKSYDLVLNESKLLNDSKMPSEIVVTLVPRLHCHTCAHCLIPNGIPLEHFPLSLPTLKTFPTITQAIGLAKLIEDKTNDQLSPPQSSNLTKNPSPISEKLTIKHLSPTELQQRRAEGLCFKCPEKYIPGHQCSPPKFLLFQSGHDPPLNMDGSISKTVSLEDKAQFQTGSIDTWATSTSGKSSFL